MLLLLIYVFVAVAFSFLCSIAEAVLLSVSTSYIVSLEQDGKKSGTVLKKLKDDINSPLTVILTLNTIAHTVGATGAGAQAAAVFGNAFIGFFSAILTLLILVFSEIIPKALGAQHWRSLAPVTAYTLNVLISAMHPFVVLSNKLTSKLASESTMQGFSRREFAAMAQLGHQEGELDEQEARILQNVFLLHETNVDQVMTPRSVIFGLNQEDSIDMLLETHHEIGFSRIPIYETPEVFTGFVLRSDVLAARASGDVDKRLKEFKRRLPAILNKVSLLRAFDEFISNDHQIMLVVNEYGDIKGLITLEDIIETLLGLEIVDERDTVADLQQLARSFSRLQKSKAKNGLKSN